MQRVSVDYCFSATLTQVYILTNTKAIGRYLHQLISETLDPQKQKSPFA